MTKAEKVIAAGRVAQARPLIPRMKTVTFVLPAYPATEVLPLTLGGEQLTIDGTPITIVGLSQ
jgi:hypothetical protein